MSTTSIDISKWTIIDLHIHSRFAAACSKFITIEELATVAKKKGINVIGTGDCLHSKWIEEIQAELNYEDDKQLLTNNINDVLFMLTTEVSNEYYDNGNFKSVHNILLFPSFEEVYAFRQQVSSFGDLDSDGRPKLNLHCRKLAEIAGGLNISIIPAHTYTPWNGIFAFKTGYNSIVEAFGDNSAILALETGLSSDPLMNSKVAATKGIPLVSFSDPHMAELSRVGREATILDLAMSEPSYKNIIGTIKRAPNLNFVGTIEVPPEYGKYHIAGHRKCKTSAEVAGVCSVCGKAMTKGVLERITELSNGGPYNTQKQFNLLPLEDLLKGAGYKPKKRKEIIDKLFIWHKTEYEILLSSDEQELQSQVGPFVAKVIMMNRAGKLTIKAGYDGQYGQPIFAEKAPSDSKKQEAPKIKSKLKDTAIIPELDAYF